MSLTAVEVTTSEAQPGRANTDMLMDLQPPSSSVMPQLTCQAVQVVTQMKVSGELYITV